MTFHREFILREVTGWTTSGFVNTKIRLVFKLLFHACIGFMECVHIFPHFQTLSKEITFRLILSASWYNQTSSFAEKTYCIFFSHTLVSSAMTFHATTKSIYKKVCYHLLILVSFSWLLFLWNAKDVLKNVDNKSVFFPIDFQCMDTKYNRSHWERKRFGNQHSSPSFVVIFIMVK